MKFTSSTLTHRLLGLSILATSLTLPLAANAATRAELSAGVSTDAVSTVTKTTKHLKHTAATKTQAAKDAVVDTATSTTTSTTETVAPATAAPNAGVSIDSSAGISDSPEGASLGGNAGASVNTP